MFLSKNIFVFLFPLETRIIWPQCFNGDVTTENRNGVCVSFYRISCITIDDGQITVKTVKIKVGGRECWLADFTLKIVQVKKYLTR